VSFIILILSDSSAAKEVASLASSGYEKAGTASFLTDFSDTLPSPPPCPLQVLRVPVARLYPVATASAAIRRTSA
jgi:hypothetical protein